MVWLLVNVYIRRAQVMSVLFPLHNNHPPKINPKIQLIILISNRLVGNHKYIICNTD